MREGLRALNWVFSKVPFSLNTLSLGDVKKKMPTMTFSVKNTVF